MFSPVATLTAGWALCRTLRCAAGSVGGGAAAGSAPRRSADRGALQCCGAALEPTPRASGPPTSRRRLPAPPRRTAGQSGSHSLFPDNQHLTPIDSYIDNTQTATLDIILGRAAERALPSHCGSAFSMAWTSSATAMSTNSNWARVRTMSARWSRRCSSEAAMSISLAPLAIRLSTMSMRQ